MKKQQSIIYLLAIILILLNTGCYQTRFIVAPPFTSIDKISKIDPGQTKDQVNDLLGIKPYDILYLQNGNFLCYYNYRLIERKFNASNKYNKDNSDNHLFSEKAQTFGEPFYTEWRRIYVCFNNGKVTHYITDSGMEDANYIELVEGTIKLLNSENLKYSNFAIPSIVVDDKSNIKLNAIGNESLEIDKILFPLKNNGKFQKTKNQDRPNPDAQKKIKLNHK